MTCAYLGGSMGSWVGARAYTASGWLGVCGLVALLAAVALARHLGAVGSALGRLDARWPWAGGTPAAWTAAAPACAVTPETARFSTVSSRTALISQS